MIFYERQNTTIAFNGKVFNNKKGSFMKLHETIKIWLLTNGSAVQVRAGEPT